MATPVYISVDPTQTPIFNITQNFNNSTETMSGDPCDDSYYRCDGMSGQYQHIAPHNTMIQSTDMSTQLETRYMPYSSREMQTNEERISLGNNWTRERTDDQTERDVQTEQDEQDKLAAQSRKATLHCVMCVFTFIVFGLAFSAIIYFNRK